jgi:hypothetical protein
MDGGADNDVLRGESGDYDKLWGGAGMDNLRDDDGFLEAHGGTEDDTLVLTLRSGWRDLSSQRRVDGTLSGGYGNDFVRLSIQDTGTFYLNVTGDERDDPASPLEGSADKLQVVGKPLDAASIIIKFETVIKP